MLGVRRLTFALAVLAPLLLSTQAAADWPTYHGNNTRQGDDTTDQAVSGSAPWTSVGLDGQLYGQPVIVGNQLVAATENNTVYWLNAATGHVDGSTHIGRPEPRTSPAGTSTPWASLGLR
jgi:polyvinyl alcohol dehydrogenase (cytochrome)